MNPFNCQVHVKSWRAFRDEGLLRLRPLTLLYGRNQAGKSSLLRLVSLISDSMREGTPALALNSASLRGATFKELGWIGKNPSFSPEITLSGTNIETGKVVTGVLQFSDSNGLLVNRFRLKYGLKSDEGVSVSPSQYKFDVDYNGDVLREHDRLSAEYNGIFMGSNWSGRLEFTRMLPKGLPPIASGMVDELSAALEPIKRLRWLQAGRLADASEGKTDSVHQSEGGDLIHILRDGRYRRVLNSASDWIAKQHRIGTEVTILQDADGRPKFVLGALGGEYLPLKLAGEGTRALMPILLNLCLADFGQDSKVVNAPSMLAIEEPEAHLHPDLQVSLFWRIVETVQKGVPVILETHSIYLLRALQVAVLKKMLSPDQVALHWVDQAVDGCASVTHIDIDNDATLRNWLPSTFEQEQELAHEILDLRWKNLEES